MKKKESIVYICMSPHVGGAERSLFATIKNIKKFTPILLVPEKGDFSQLAKKHCTIYALRDLKKIQKTLNIFKLIKYYKDIKKVQKEIVALLQKNNAKIIHCNSLVALLYCIGLPRKYNIKKVLHVREIFQSALTQLILNILILFTDNVVAISKAVSKQILWKHKVKVIYNCIETDVKPTVKPKKTNQKNIIMVGRYKAMKGHRVFIKAATEILKKYKDVRFTIYGKLNKKEETKYVQKLKKSVPAIYRNKIRFNGYAKNIADIYSNADILLHLPTKPEGFGRIFLEAGMYTLPVITTPLGGIAEVITKNKTGLYVRKNNVRDVVEKIEFYLNNTKRAHFIAAQLHATVYRKFTTKKHISKIEKVYTSL